MLRAPMTGFFHGSSSRVRYRVIPVLAASVVILLSLSGELAPGQLGAFSGPGASVSAQICNPPSAMPSALFIPESDPSHSLLAHGRVQASYEFQVVNYTARVYGTTIVVPNVLALFPLSSGPDFQVPFSWAGLTVNGSGWSPPTTSSAGAATNLSFNASVPPQLLTEGWLPGDPHADAVLAQSAYGNLTLAFRWQWSMTEPNGTVYSSAWSVPNRSASPPYLPSIFYPAEHVWSLGATSPVVIGGNFSDEITGMISGRSFDLTWTDTSGNLLAQGLVNVSQGVRNASAGLALTSAAHRLAPGTYVFKVRDSCGAVVEDLWISASFASTATAQLRVSPSTCGTILLNGTAYQSGSAPSARPSVGSYPLTATGCSGDAFTGWTETGGLLPASEWARNTRLFVSWDGAVTAGWARGYNVTFRESGVPSGQNWSVTILGSTVRAVAPNPISFFLANGTYTYYVGNGTGFSLAGAGSSGTVQIAGGSVGRNLSLATDIQHVVVIVMENSNLYPTLDFAPYMHYLWNTYARATSFYGACHESKPEYMAMTSGRPYTCTSIPVQSVTNLGDLLENQGLTWGDYQESMNTSCDNVSSHFYFTHHNPFLWYSDIALNATRCDAHIVNSRSFNQTVANGTLPTYSLYIPNTYDDCEYTKLPVCDTWLKGFLAPLLNSTHPAVQALVAHTAFVVAFDEAQTNLGYSTGGIVNSWCRNTTGQNLTVCGGHIYLSLVSPFSYGRSYAANSTDYNLESTVEWLFRLGSDGGYDGTSNFPSMDSLFAFPQNGAY